MGPQKTIRVESVAVVRSSALALYQHMDQVVVTGGTRPKVAMNQETKVMAVWDFLTTIIMIVLLGVRPWLIVVCSTVHNRSFISIAYWRHFIIKSVSWEVSWNHGLVFSHCSARRFA